MTVFATVAEDIGVIVTALAAFVSALAGFLVVMRRLRQNHEAVQRVYEHVNNVESSTRLPPGAEPRTLGQAIMQLRGESREGFARNDATHTSLLGAIVEHDKRIGDVHGEVSALRLAVGANGARLDRLEDDALEP